ncbi:MAG: biotin transporter BioY [Rhodospirillaceae bacterium]|nr:MAG: biotin transporter BioY [Rhodospirillaceae bacterium]
MIPITTTSSTLADAVWPHAEGKSWARNIILAIVGSLLLTLSAKIQIPFWPVPMTMQTFAVLVIAMAYGPRLGTATILLYLAQGTVGLPVFAGTPEKGIGLAYMAGPTGGYLVGFLTASVCLGYLNTRGWDRSVLTTLVAMTLGTAIIFGFGYGWLTTLIGAEKAWILGVQPFLLGAVLKIALAAAVLPTLWKVLNRDAN